MKKIAVLLVFLLLPAGALLSLSFFQQGEELFLNNKPAEALVMLEAALAQDDGSEAAKNGKIYLYLGIIYEQLGDFEKAVQILRLGMEAAPDGKDKMAFNLGNNLMRLGDFEAAESAYSDLIKTSPAFADAYLNRANARIKLAKLKEAAEDYSRFLVLKPSTPQRANIEKVIGLIQQDLAEKERQKAEEERRKAEEEARRVAEEKRKAEEERKRLEEEKRLAQEAEKARIEEEKRKAEEEARKAEEERLRLEEEKRLAEEAEKARIEEEKRKAEEEARKAEEERLRREEEARRAEEERQRQEALLREVMDSLTNASVETQNKQAGSEDIQTYDFNLDLKD